MELNRAYIIIHNYAPVKIHLCEIFLMINYNANDAKALALNDINTTLQAALMSYKQQELFPTYIVKGINKILYSGYDNNCFC